MNCLFIIFIFGMNMCSSFFYIYPNKKICKILNCNKNYGTEYDLEMDKEEHEFHILNFNYSNTNYSNQNIVLRK
jgi:hypothetical protein